jgi:hypothetical protein
VTADASRGDESMILSISRQGWADWAIVSRREATS